MIRAGQKHKMCCYYTHSYYHPDVSDVNRILAWPGMRKAQYWALTQFGARYLTGP